jgi:hypothetical protein
MTCSNRHLGKFYIDLNIIESGKENTIIKKIMSQCIILRAEVLYYRNAIKYVAISDNFDSVEDGMMIPEYTWIYTKDTDILTCEKIKEI